jgi:glucose-1-phosphate cytidylyltransferase
MPESQRHSNGNITRLSAPPKVVILCGGLGTRLREETEFRPKPLVPIGGRPILWHIMKTYSVAGCREFILALGYRGEMIKEYFLNYEVYNNDFSIELRSKHISVINSCRDEQDWRVTLVDTGNSSMTGGRLKRLEPYLKDEQDFMVTYGDGVADIDVGDLLAFHRSSDCDVTITGVRPLARFGELRVVGDRVSHFAEKPQTGDDWINGGYFVMTPAIFEDIEGDGTVLEKEPLERMAQRGRMAVYRHDGFWRCMDTYRDMESLNQQWASGLVPWKRW